MNKNLKNKYIHINSPTSENLLKIPESKIIKIKKPKTIKTEENFSLKNQHIQEIYNIKTITPLIYTKITKYFKYIILAK